MARNTRVLLFAGVAAVLLFWFAVVAPLREEVDQLGRALPEFRRQHADMVRLYDAYQQLVVDERALEQWVRDRPDDFALFGLVTEVAQRQGVTPASLRPTAKPLDDQWQLERVKVELTDVSVQTLIGFLHGLTAPHNVVRVQAFELRGSQSGLNVTFDVHTLTLREQPGV